MNIKNIFFYELIIFTLFVFVNDLCMESHNNNNNFLKDDEIEQKRIFIWTQLAYAMDDIFTNYFEWNIKKIGQNNAVFYVAVHSDKKELIKMHNQSLCYLTKLKKKTMDIFTEAQWIMINEETDRDADRYADGVELWRECLMELSGIVQSIYEKDSPKKYELVDNNKYWPSCKLMYPTIKIQNWSYGYHVLLILFGAMLCKRKYRCDNLSNLFFTIIQYNKITETGREGSFLAVLAEQYLQRKHTENIIVKMQLKTFDKIISNNLINCAYHIRQDLYL